MNIKLLNWDFLIEYKYIFYIIISIPLLRLAKFNITRIECADIKQIDFEFRHEGKVLVKKIENDTKIIIIKNKYEEYEYRFLWQKDDVYDYLSVGDSIYKQEQSYTIKIFKKNGQNKTSALKYVCD